VLGVVIVVLLLLLFTCELHKDNNVLGIVVLFFAKLHCTQEKKSPKKKMIATPNNKLVARCLLGGT
jgi:hypothetical protein